MVLYTHLLLPLAYPRQMRDGFSLAYSSGPATQAALSHSLAWLVWLSLTVCWLCNWWRHRRWSIRLHRLLTVILICKLIMATAMMLVCMTSFVNGNRRTVLTNAHIYAQAIVMSVLEGLQFAMFLLMGFGWCISQPFLFRHERLVTQIALASSAVSLIVVWYVPSYFAVWPVIAYYWVQRLVFLSARQKGDYLHSFLLYSYDAMGNPIVRMRFPGLLSDQSRSPLQRKVELFTKLRVVVALWFVVSLLTEVLAVYLDLYQVNVANWMAVATYECVDLLTASVVGRMFLLRHVHLPPAIPPQSQPLTRLTPAAVARRQQEPVQSQAALLAASQSMAQPEASTAGVTIYPTPKLGEGSIVALVVPDAECDKMLIGALETADDRTVERDFIRSVIAHKGR
ncbi:hypothetical protein RI367_004199 [Sorochytrium milnesiophthora]